MGRYYDTDNGRHGKFWFATQGSDAPENFGMYQHPDDPNEEPYVLYYCEQDDFNMEYYLELCGKLGVSPGTEEVNYDLVSPDDGADYALGTIIFLDLKETGECTLNAEY